MSIAQELRTVGQGLESLGVEDFDLESDGDGYFALGISRPAVPATRKLDLKQLARRLRRGVMGQKASDRKLAELGPEVLRVLFTPEGLLRLEAAGMAKRNPVAAGLPNFTRLGQALRMVGEYLDTKAARLLKVRKRGAKISIEYETANANRASEQWKVARLYDRWLEHSRERREASSVARRGLGNLTAAREATRPR